VSRWHFGHFVVRQRIYESRPAKLPTASSRCSMTMKWRTCDMQRWRSVQTVYISFQTYPGCTRAALWSAALRLCEMIPRQDKDCDWRWLLSVTARAGHTFDSLLLGGKTLRACSYIPLRVKETNFTTTTPEDDWSAFVPTPPLCFNQRNVVQMRELS